MRLCPGHLPNSYQTTSNECTARLWHTFIKGSTREREISSESLNMLQLGSVSQAGDGCTVCSTIKPTACTHKYNAVDETKSEWEEARKQYSVNVHRNRTVRNGRHSLCRKINMQLKIFFPMHQLYDTTFSSELSVQRGLYFRGFSHFSFFLSFFFTVPCTVSVCVRVKDKAELTSNSLVPLNNTSQHCQLYLWSTLDGACSVTPSQ